MEAHSIHVIAHIRSDFQEKFGIPRQSGLVEDLEAAVVFEPEYRNVDALRGIEGFSHLWLIWQFSQAVRDSWSPTVRPPRLGGNTRLGVFATRSPFRPNPIGLSCVRMKELRNDPKLGPILIVSGADLLDGTPIYDVKPYLPYADSRPDALGGFAGSAPEERLQVIVPENAASILPPQKLEALRHVLALDPRPSYQNDPDREYGMRFSDWDIRFCVEGSILRVCSVTAAAKHSIPENECGRRIDFSRNKSYN